MRMVFPNNTTGRLLDELSSDVNAFFESILGEDGKGEDGKTVKSAVHAPRVDLEDREEAYELAVDLPGVKADDIHVDVEDDHLVIHGTRHAWKEADENVTRHLERINGDFRRVVRLPKPVNKDAVEAKFEFGVLTVTLPKVAKEGPRRVTISQGGEQTA